MQNCYFSSEKISKYMLHIRYTSGSDQEFIHRLIEQLEEHAVDRAEFERVFFRNLECRDIFYFTAEQENRVVGFISLHIQFLLHHAGEIAEVQELCVDEEWRGKGVGKALLEHAVSIAESRGCALIELSANKKREAAHRFYEREGWKRSHYKFTLELK